MPFYSIRMMGGTRAEHLDMREMFHGRDPDRTGHTEFFYVEREYDLATMERNAKSAGGKRMEVAVEEITESEFHWRRAYIKR